MAKRDYYQVLGIPKTASEKEIKRAYRRLARQYHPDVNREDRAAEAKFKEVNEAHEVLSNADNRKKYDRFGIQWKHAGQFAGRARQRGPTTSRWEHHGPASGFDFATDGQGSPFGDLFGSMFSGRAGAGPPNTKGQDIEHAVDVTLEEACHGTKRILQLVDPSGVPRRLEVKIPAGVRTGSRVRVAREGGPGVGGGAKGNLFLLVAVLPHATFERRGDDLHLEVPVDLNDAILGTEIEVPTLNGAVVLNIPPETQNGRTFRLTGRGMPRLGNPGKGSLHATIKVVLPTGLTAGQRELFEQLRRSQGQE